MVSLFPLFSILSLALSLLILVGFVRVIWFAWVGPQRLDQIMRNQAAIASRLDGIQARLDQLPRDTHSL
jgi:hypothetical protein